LGYEYATGDVIPFIALASEKLISFPDDVIESFHKRIHGHVKAHGRASQMLVDKEMWQQTYNQLSEAIKYGYGEAAWGTPDFLLNQNLKYNAATFAAFKNHDEINKIQELLLDGTKVRKWEDFRDKALKISDKYNKRWLQTEYNHAVQSSRMARRWQDDLQNADLYPSLQYITMGDERVRHSHQQLHGAIYPIGDAFWDTFYPPNGWGCRCAVRPTDSPAQVEKGRPEMPAMFKNNPGKSGKAFTENHPYFSYKKDTKKKVIAFVDKQNIKGAKK